MKGSVLLSPHNDDETLFAAFTIMRHGPDIVICTRSQVQEDRYGIHAETREQETRHAVLALAPPPLKPLKLTQMTLSDTTPLDVMETILTRDISELVDEYGICYAPAVEENGHEHHSLIGRLAVEAFGEDRVVPFLTYRRGSMRSRSETEVEGTPSMIARKLRAMACYHSQIALDNTRPWFTDDTIREWYA